MKQTANLFCWVASCVPLGPITRAIWRLVHHCSLTAPIETTVDTASYFVWRVQPRLCDVLWWITCTLIVHLMKQAGLVEFWLATADIYADTVGFNATNRVWKIFEVASPSAVTYLAIRQLLDSVFNISSRWININFLPQGCLLKIWCILKDIIDRKYVASLCLPACLSTCYNSKTAKEFSWNSILSSFL